MEIHNDWYNDVARQINLHKGALTKRDYKKYRLDLLLRVAKRVADFSVDCGECQNWQGEIKRLTGDLGYLVQMPNKERRKNYFNTINNIIKHLQKKHKLVREGQNIAIGIAIGTGIGAGIGAVLDSTGAGTGIGIAIGIAIGSYLDSKAKKEGKVI